MTESTTDAVVLGTMLFGTTIDEPTTFALLDRYVDAGGVWIDTADCYVFWADRSGFGGQSEHSSRPALRASRRRHRAPGGHGAGARGLVEDGLVHAIGHSNTALWRTERARGLAAVRGLAGPTVLQLRYSYLQPRPMVRGRVHVRRFGWLTDEALDLGQRDPSVALWAYSPLLGGGYDRPDRPLDEARRHQGNDRRPLPDAARTRLAEAW